MKPQEAKVDRTDRRRPFRRPAGLIWKVFPKLGLGGAGMLLDAVFKGQHMGFTAC